MLRHALLFAVLCIVFAGCRSGEYTRAYNHAKEEGKSDFYAKAYAEQAEAGKGKVYAKAYAFALETSQEGIGFTQYDDKTKKVWARIYAKKIYEGQNFVYAAIYAKHYCNMLPIAMEKGYDEKFVHQYAKYYVKIESVVDSLFPRRDSKYIEDFSQKFATEMALGATMEQAVEKAFKYANSNLIK